MYLYLILNAGMSTLFALPSYNCIDNYDLHGRKRASGNWCIPRRAPTSLGRHGRLLLRCGWPSGLLEAIERNVLLKVLVLHRGRSETTGGQRIPDGTLERVIKAML
jgi:hypothetical protein